MITERWLVDMIRTGPLAMGVGGQIACGQPACIQIKQIWSKEVATVHSQVEKARLQTEQEARHPAIPTITGVLDRSKVIEGAAKVHMSRLSLHEYTTLLHMFSPSFSF